MKKNKIIQLALLVGLVASMLAFWLVPQQQVSAQEKIEINLFYSPTCPHCTKEREFLDTIEVKYPQVAVNRYPITNAENVERLNRLYQEYKLPAEAYGLVPVTFIADKFFLGFSDKIAQDMESCIANLCKVSLDGQQDQVKKFTRQLSLPFVGQVDAGELSPLTLSVVVGFLDGFNVCSMMALLFLLTATVATGRRGRVILVGGTFILVSGLVYFLFISAWLNLFMFLGYLRIMTIGVAVVIMLFAVVILKEYFTDIICKLCDVENDKESIFVKAQKKLFTQMVKLSTKEMPLSLTLLGVALVAIGVNTVELVCSLGFPMAYTKILASHQLSGWLYYLYLLVYIFFYMLIAFVIFAVAAVTLRVTRFSDKYFKLIKLVSGVVLLLLGLAILFKPELLTF